MTATALTTACYSSLTAFLSALPPSVGGYLKTLNKNGVFTQTGAGVAAQRAAIRASLIAMPAEVCSMLPHDTVALVDSLLAAELSAANVVDVATLPRAVPSAPSIVVWQGDMSLLRCDAVVNPGNNQLLGCFLPSHKCLDNILHAQAGPRLRIACAQMLQQLGITADTNGQCRVTPAFALPSRLVFHTVGPCLLAPYPSRAPARAPTDVDRRELRLCYQQCLDAAAQLGLRSIAFCCISTGIFGYPADEAAHIALTTTRAWLEARAAPAATASAAAAGTGEGDAAAVGAPPPLTVVFNVFKDEDLAIYLDLAPKVFAA